jgi:hypothetical protein
LGQAFKYHESEKAFLGKACIITSQSTHQKLKSYKFNTSGENQCDKSTFIVSQSIHQKTRVNMSLMKAGMVSIGPLKRKTQVEHLLAKHHTLENCRETVSR